MQFLLNQHYYAELSFNAKRHFPVGRNAKCTAKSLAAISALYQLITTITIRILMSHFDKKLLKLYFWLQDVVKK